MNQKRTAPLSVRLSPELNARLEGCAKSLRLKKHALAQEAIEAAVDAIEANGFRLVVPVKFEVKFEVTHVATPRVKYEEHNPQHAVVEDKPSSSSAKTESPADAFREGTSGYVRRKGDGARKK